MVYVKNLGWFDINEICVFQRCVVSSFTNILPFFIWKFNCWPISVQKYLKSHMENKKTILLLMLMHCKTLLLTLVIHQVFSDACFFVWTLFFLEIVFSVAKTQSITSHRFYIIYLLQILNKLVLEYSQITYELFINNSKTSVILRIEC